MSQSKKSLMMVLAIVCGALFSTPIAFVDNLTGHLLAPILLFTMLFVTFCCVDLRDLRFSKLHLWLLLFQLVSGVAAYYLTLPLGEVVAQGVMICLITPVAMAAVVIGQMLGASVVSIASFSIVNNVVMALFIPLFFAQIGGEGCSFGMIISKVAPLMVAPPLLAQALRHTVPSVTEWFGGRGYISFYLWVASLFISIGRTGAFIIDNRSSIEPWIGGVLALAALVTCLLQYRVGNIIGARYGDRVAGQQSLGQKNTILAIWMTQTFLSPLSSLAPTAYIIWQNLLNSYLLYKNRAKQ